MRLRGWLLVKRFGTLTNLVCNSDVKYAYKHLMPKQVKRPKKTLAQEPSSSALIFYWGLSEQFPEMDLHNIIFSEDYREEFENIRTNGPFWEDPTVYIHISNRLEPGDAPENKDCWFVMVNTPYDQRPRLGGYRSVGTLKSFGAYLKSIGDCCRTTD